nr:Gag-Pol polyprotein [Tanacetum cinerariifolium]
MKTIKGALLLMREEKVAANLYELKGEIIEEAEASVALHSPSHRVTVTWHQKLGHISQQGMKILVERNLLPGLTKKIKCFRMDNGGKYTSDEFDTFYKHEGIKRQFTTTYTPQQNGVTERMNKTWFKRARAMLATTSLEKSFWAEAINTACYVINQSSSTTVELKTPIEMWT